MKNKKKLIVKPRMSESELYMRERLMSCMYTPENPFRRKVREVENKKIERAKFEQLCDRSFE